MILPLKTLKEITIKFARIARWMSSEINSRYGNPKFRFYIL